VEATMSVFDTTDEASGIGVSRLEHGDEICCRFTGGTKVLEVAAKGAAGRMGRGIGISFGFRDCSFSILNECLRDVVSLTKAARTTTAAASRSISAASGSSTGTRRC